MRKNRVLKQQDIIILGILITGKDWPSQREIADSISLSQAEVSHAFKTLESVGLINLEKKTLNKLAIAEFIEHAIKYFYPIEKKGMGRGLAVGPSYPYFKSKVQSEEYNYVWPDSAGETKGVIIVPLLANLAQSVKGNEKLLVFLNTVEIFRGLGGVRHMQVAQKALKEILK
jgi:DNA-binding Lrp family transcriptional regulator